MRTELIPVTVAGTTLLVEARISGGDEEIGGGAARQFAAVLKPITAMAQQITKSLASAKPTRATIEFGFDFAVEAGHLTAFVVSGSGQASFKVMLEWAGHDQPAG
jgi:hypothetical protein